MGGFFGGNKDIFNEFLVSCNERINTILDDEKLYSEETIMEIIFSENIEKYVYNTFTTWVHKERGVYTRMSEEEKKYFDINHKPYYKSIIEI